jgi:hypothetical protein
LLLIPTFNSVLVLTRGTEQIEIVYNYKRRLIRPAGLAICRLEELGKSVAAQPKKLEDSEQEGPVVQPQP